MPCYNAEKTIDDSIRSVISQTYQNWELIIVDDFSSDRTKEIVLGCAVLNPKIKYFRLNSNTGSPSAPRNKALSLAQGEYIAFLDSDDKWYENKIELQLSFMIKYNCKFTYTSYDILDTTSLAKCTYIAKDSADYFNLLKNNHIGCLTVMVKKDLLESCTFLDKGHEDFIFWLQLLKKGVVARKVLAPPLAEYRIESGSRSSNKIKALKSLWLVYYKFEKLGFSRSCYFITVFLFNQLKKKRVLS
jgi:teichuronic acid biosynthesis glycosyltransferase TuaG